MQCSFNKGSDDGGSTDSTSVVELLQDISSRMARLEAKVDNLAERMEDLVDNYNPDCDIKYPDDLSSKSIMAEFEASRMELRKSSDIYSKVLHKMAQQRLDRDMVMIKVKGLESLTKDTPLGMEDLYELLNKSFWVGTTGADGLHKQMLARNKFLWACQDFYNVKGHQKEWQLWKRLLKDQEEYRVEDSDELLDKEEEVRNDMVPGVESVGVLELDALIKMPMPEEDPVEEAEKEARRQATAQMRAYKWSKGKEVESKVELYKDLELVLVQEMNEEERELGEDVNMVDLSSAKAL